MQAPQLLLDAGYFPKHIAPRPQWLDAPAVVEICSVSNCISSGPENWIDPWLHNDFGWFNRIPDARRVVPPDQETAYRIFAFRLYTEVFTPDGRIPLVLPGNVRPEPIDVAFRTLGFDVASRTPGMTVLGFECSPLSCNMLAAEIGANAFCLFHGLDKAIAGAERFATEQPEPGHYYVVEVLERTAVK